MCTIEVLHEGNHPTAYPRIAPSETMASTVTGTTASSVTAAPGLVLGAIGVVFGDIGTSPIYTLRECLKAAGGASPANVFGIESLILWSILVVVTLKYVSFVMRADNDGEEGILALTALASRVAPARLQQMLLTVGVFGAAMFYGDSMITLAISVLSAVEGITLIDAHLSVWIVPAALVILVCFIWSLPPASGRRLRRFMPWNLSYAIPERHSSCSVPYFWR